MGLFTSINIAASGMTAERLRTDVISDNIANASTTRTQDGGAFRRSRVVLSQKENGVDWRTAFTPSEIDRGPGSGVKVVTVEKDNADLRLVYDPTHPDAIKSGPKAGYVEYPNVNIVTEMVDLISASRSYEANASVIQGSKEMFMQALNIGR
jgi:flagellar basal-body rod protein FlgC